MKTFEVYYLDLPVIRTDKQLAELAKSMERCFTDIEKLEKEKKGAAESFKAKSDNIQETLKSILSKVRGEDLTRVKCVAHFDPQGTLFKSVRTDVNEEVPAQLRGNPRMNFSTPKSTKQEDRKKK